MPFFSLTRGGPDRDPVPRYQPFRLTPYVTKIRVSEGAPAQPCCLLIAERIHSGYEGGQARSLAWWGWREATFSGLGMRQDMSLGGMIKPLGILEQRRYNKDERL